MGGIAFDIVEKASEEDVSVKPGDGLTIGSGGYSAGWRTWRITNFGKLIERKLIWK